MRSVLAVHGAALLSAAVAATTMKPAAADDFRILSRVYVGDSKEPSSQTTTLFRAGLVYDCIDTPAEVVVFDPNGGRFVLLDVERMLRAEIALHQIDALLPTLKQKVSRQKDSELSGFLTAPKFDVQEEIGATEFKSPRLSYRVKAVAARNDDVAGQYAAFSANYTRLNTLKHPMLLARAAVNDWLNERRLIPEEVRLTTYKKTLIPGRMALDTQFKSQHIITWGLSTEDLRRIEQIERWLVEFREVRLTEYWERKETTNE